MPAGKPVAVARGMEDKQFRSLFLVLLGFAAFVSFLWTVTTIFPDPGGIGFAFRVVVCAGLTLMFAAAFALEIFGIWTGHLPRSDSHNHQR